MPDSGGGAEETPRPGRGGTGPPVASAAVELWWDYRRVWATHPWLLVYAVVFVLMFAAAVYGTVVRDALAVLFIPSLGGLYLHHLMAMKRLNQS